MSRAADFLLSSHRYQLVFLVMFLSVTVSLYLSITNRPVARGVRLVRSNSPSAASSTCIHVTVVVVAVNCLTFSIKMQMNLHQNEPFQVKKSQGDTPAHTLRRLNRTPPPSGMAGYKPDKCRLLSKHVN